MEALTGYLERTKKKKKRQEKAKLHYLSAVTAVVRNLGSRHVNLTVYRKGWDMEKRRSPKQAVYTFPLYVI